MAWVAHRIRALSNRPREAVVVSFWEREVNQEVISSSTRSSPSVGVCTHHQLPIMVAAPIGLKRQHIGSSRIGATMIDKFTQIISVFFRSSY